MDYVTQAVTLIIQGISGSIPLIIFVWKSYPSVTNRIDSWVKEIKELRNEHHNDLKNQMLLMHNDIIEVKSDIVVIRSNQETMNQYMNRRISL
jgi:hypothetical protein